MDYSKLGDFEINKLIGDVVFKGLWSCRPGTAGNKSDSWYYGNADASLNPLSPLPDYCNDAAAAWPIITANKISIYAMSDADKRGGWGAEAFHPNDAYSFNDNPLRAAMIVFLMMQESANVPANSTGSDIR
ncbi:phage protein NinX family protein [Enterobacter hormaechei]|uniref:phage protein NinX family protein n=1 Tax=Enterobacter hormaechei TaxID=158836 RepID=UPI00092EBC24|nr:phage protein NinX family protein [Enterobacter hormaechei]HBK4725109.1 DUF2591 family protein [Enterobacter hormaechei subsp. steigerwaltii]HBK4820414.1 DUF2591 family protein [Enterobacter hormaechei subsp. steigerwaltii]HCR1968576.1 DUF2591 family protein [Enterobacter hormaechei subsp. xiangfangensis]HEO9969652.1 DUF2591 family protein [Enterobacter hormaechei subsp. xiangfangensis]